MGPHCGRAPLPDFQCESDGVLAKADGWPLNRLLKRHPGGRTFLSTISRDTKRGVLRRTTRADQRTNAPYSIGPAGDLAVGQAPAALSSAAGDFSLSAAAWHSGPAIGRATSISAFPRTSSKSALRAHRHGVQGSSPDSVGPAPPDMSCRTTEATPPASEPSPFYFSAGS
jgi:hypothetical protein